MRDYVSSENIIVPGTLNIVVSEEVTVLSAFVARAALVESLDSLMISQRSSPGPIPLCVRIDISGWDGDRPSSLALAGVDFQPISVPLE
jgi:hypothetical protein